MEKYPSYVLLQVAASKKLACVEFSRCTAHAEAYRRDPQRYRPLPPMLLTFVF